MLAYTETVRQLFSAFLVEQALLPSGPRGNVPGRADQGLRLLQGTFLSVLTHVFYARISHVMTPGVIMKRESLSGVDVYANAVHGDALVALVALQ